LRALPASVRTVVLMHLSEANNRPDLARACAEDALRGRDVDLYVACQDEPLKVPRRPRPMAPAALSTASVTKRAVQLSLF